MAGDWIKMRHDLKDDPAVITIAEAVNLDEDCVVGKLHRFWVWADRQTIDGNAPSVTAAWLDRYVGVSGSADAMMLAGWLDITDGGLRVPKFDSHISESAKRRALTARRAAKSRNAKRNAPSVTKSAPREEKRREEEQSCSSQVSEYTTEFETWWLLCPRKIGKRKAFTEFKQAKKRVSIDHLTEAMKRFAASVAGKEPRYIVYPERWLSKGRYDDEESDRESRAPTDQDLEGWRP